MNSFNHYAYGAVVGWMYNQAAGIGFDAANPGFKHIILSPNPDQTVAFIDATFDSAYGPITSNVGILTYREGEVSHTFDTRIPPLFQTNDILAKLEEFCGKHGVRVEAVKNIPSTYTPADSEYCRTIAGAFESITGIHPRFYTSGGRTYAVELGERALAYGPVGTAPVGHCHGNDEYISLKALQDLAGIYYETVRRLFC
jgi:acetylornithine deacetylase/succinyl-diaminopimelate desuccinylase-like protein